MIEDNPGDARLIQEMLNEAGADRFDLKCIDRLYKGLELLSTEDFDVVMLDLGLPDSQGLDTFSKAYNQAPETPIVVLTGLDDEEQTIKAIERGAQDYLIKGRVDSQLLTRAIRYAIERKRAEKILRISEKSLAEAQRIVHLGNWDWDIEKDVLTWSDEIYRIFGLKPQEFKANINAFYERIHPEDVDLVKKANDETLYGKQDYSIDHRIVRPDGSTRIVHEQAEVFFNESDKPIRMIGTVQDITKRKKMEEELKHYSERLEDLVEERTRELKQSEEKFRHIYYASINAIYTTSLNGEILDMNPAGVSMLGFDSLEELRKTNIERLYVNPDDRKRIIKLAEKGPIKGFEAKLKRNDGKIIETIINSYPIKDDKGELTRFQGAIIDITERKRIENELKRRSEEIKALSESASLKLIQRTSQINNIFKVRERLREPPDVSTGLKSVLDAALNDLGMDAGAILIVNREKNTINLRILNSKIKEIKVEDSVFLDKGFVELEAIEKNKNISKIIKQDEPSIMGTVSVHCAPILFGKELHGILVLGSQKEVVLDDVDISILGLYSELVSTIFEAHKLTVTPAKETTESTERRFELEFGCPYLVKDSVERAFEVFADNVLSGVEGLCITREFPPKIREKYGLKKTPIIWLTEEKEEGEMTVYSLQDLSILIGSFLEKAKRSIVLLDGFEFLITNNGFESFIRFLQLNRNRFEREDSILIAPILEEALNMKEAKLVEREMKPFKLLGK